MPLQLRRGTEAERQSMTQHLAEGEPLYISDTNLLYLGIRNSDGSYPLPGQLVSPLVYTDEEARDAITLMLENGAHPDIQYNYDDNVNTLDVILNLGAISQDIIPDTSEAYDLGSATYRFRDLYLSGSSLWVGAAQITATGTTVELPIGSVIDGSVIITQASNGQTVNELTDATITGAADGEVLTYNDAGSVWVNQAIVTDKSVEELTDTTITGAADGEVLTYNDASSKWINQASGAGNPFDQPLNTFDPVSFAGIDNLNRSLLASNCIMIIGGNDTMTGDDNICIGYSAGDNITDGSENVFIGYNAGYDNIDGDSNVFIGPDAGYYNDSGSYNVFIGDAAGENNISGENNVFLGYAGLYNTTGSGNVFIGNYAGEYHETGTNNIFIGEEAGSSQLAGTNNVFIGYYAGDGGSDSESEENVCIGSYAGQALDNLGRRNVILGQEAGYNLDDGNDNFIVGYQAAYSTGDAENSIYIGNQAGYNDEYGENNIFLGYHAGYVNQYGNNNFVAGYEAAGNGGQQLDDCICIGNRSGYLLSSAQHNVFLGSHAGFGTDNGDYNTFIGYNAGYENTSGNHNIFIGSGAGDNVLTGSNLICLGEGSKPSSDTATNQMIVGSALEVIKVGLGGQDNPQEVLDVTGNIVASGSITGSEPWNIHTTTAANEGITAVINNKYMVDTTASTANIVITMPGAEIGDSITVTDMKNNFASGGTKNVVTNTIMFEGVSQTFEFDVVNSTAQLVYTGSSYGWKAIVIQ